MAEEFQESEVIFPESAVKEGNDESIFPNSSNMKRKKKKKKKKSVPVNIPENGSGNSCSKNVDSDEEIVPPHVILARRISGKMAFSVCIGNGRTLKGRDLREVRNSILSMTGFLET